MHTLYILHKTTLGDSREFKVTYFLHLETELQAALA